MKLSPLLKGIGLAVLVASTLVPVTGYSATTYKWTDDEGNIVYGDRPPKGVDAEMIRISTGTSSSQESASAAKTPAEQEEEANAKAKAAQTAGVSPEKAKEFCQQAKGNLEVLENNALIRQADENGEERILSETEKLEQINTAREISRRYCN